MFSNADKLSTDSNESTVFVADRQQRASLLFYFMVFFFKRGLSEFPHLAGTDADYKQAKELHDFWKTEGLDDAFITPYDVLLSYPNTTDPSVMNRIFVYDQNGAIAWESALYEPILHPSENKSNVVPPFNAFSAPGNITSVRIHHILLIFLYTSVRMCTNSVVKSGTRLNV